MSLNGTVLYAALDGFERQTVPPLVRRAVEAAESLGFELCIHPATGRLLHVLTAGLAPGSLVGETGTGTGAGLAWMVSAASPGVDFVSVELDPVRADAARTVFVNHPNVTILTGDAGELFKRGPFDLLVHDGGWGSGKADSRRVEAADVLKPGGTMTIDDYGPMATWPPKFQGEVDEARHFWLTQPELLATEIQVAPDMAALVIRRRPKS